MLFFQVVLRLACAWTCLQFPFPPFIFNYIYCCFLNWSLSLEHLLGVYRQFVGPHWWQMDTPGDRIYMAMSVERWRDSDSEEGMWKPWNVDTHPDSTIVSIWDKPLSLLITFGLWFPSISLLFNYKSKLKRIFLLQKIYSSQCYHFFFNLNLIQKINFLVSLDSDECQ